MNEINWNEAPADATHARLDNPSSPFRKKDGGGFWYAWAGQPRRWIVIGKTGIEQPEYIPRPHPYELPAIGSVCADGNDPTPFTIIAHVDQGATAPEGWQWLALGQAPDNGPIRMANATAWKPYRTPEQIASDKRRESIEEMVYEGCGAERGGNNTAAFILCGLLYDAGYRKVGE